jgi:cytochrome c-type biogenesis protein CcmH
LTNFADVVVGARISKSGQATPTAGDLTGQSAPVKSSGAAVSLVIDSVQP